MGLGVILSNSGSATYRNPASPKLQLSTNTVTTLISPSSPTGGVVHLMLSSDTKMIVQFPWPIITRWEEPVPMLPPRTVILVPPDLGPIAGIAGGRSRKGAYRAKIVNSLSVSPSLPLSLSVSLKSIISHPSLSLSPLFLSLSLSLSIMKVWQ